MQSLRVQLIEAYMDLRILPCKARDWKSVMNCLAFGLSIEA